MMWDAVVVVSFGGPERPDDVLPFLDNVLRGRNVPRERRAEVAEHYYQMGGRSPIGAANRAMVAALQQELDGRGHRLPVYLGNRNWHPLLADTLRELAAAGVRRALALVTSAFGSYSGCRQYLDDMEQARAEVGANAPELGKIRLFFNHPDFIAINAERVRGGLARAGSEAALIFTAHSIPTAMAHAGPYVEQLNEACRLVGQAAGRGRFALAYQSRSGPPQQPWLGPSLESALAQARQGGARSAVVAPIGFLSDHMEVVYDLDVEAQAQAEKLGLGFVRVATPGDHPRFAALLADLIEERLGGAQPRRAVGALAAWGDECPEGCCIASPSQRATTAAARQLPSTLTAVRPISRN